MVLPVEAWVAIGAVFVALNSLFGLLTLMYARRTELNTNSMKDALVARTAESFEAKGRDEERVRGALKAADVAGGRLDASRSQAKAPAASTSAAVIKEAAIEVIEPIAEEAVAKGAKAAVSEMKQEDEAKK